MVEATHPTTRELADSLDRNLTRVMPETWAGHARIAIRERDDVSGKTETVAVELAERLLEKDKAATAEEAARKAVAGARKAVEE